MNCMMPSVSSRQNILRLDKAYTTSKGAYKLSYLSHVGSSDHISVMEITDCTTLNNHTDLQEYTLTVIDYITKEQSGSGNQKS